MYSEIVDANAPRYKCPEPRCPENLPHGFIPPPPELVAQVGKERAKHPPEFFNDAYAKLTLDAWTLTYYYEGFDVAYRSVDQGVEVLAVGLDEIGELVKGKSQQELLTFTVKRP